MDEFESLLITGSERFSNYSGFTHTHTHTSKQGSKRARVRHVQKEIFANH